MQSKHPSRCARVMRAACGTVFSVFAALHTLTATAQDRVTFLLDFLPSGEFAAYYAGVAEGFFQEQNIDLTINRGYGGGDTVAKVGAGAAQFGFADISAAFTARAKAGIPVKILSAMYSYSPHSMFVLESSGIQNFKDLAGKRVGITPGNSHRLYFPEVAKRAGLDASRLQWVNVEPASMASLLIAKKLDAAPFYAIHHYYTNKAAEAQGEKIRVMPYVETGFTIYAATLISNENTVKNTPDLVRRFLRAAWKSVNWAREHPEATCTHHVRANPEVKHDDCLGSLRAVHDVVFTDFARKTGLGRFDPQRLRNTWEQVVKAQGLDAAFDYPSVIDTSYLPATMP